MSSKAVKKEKEAERRSDIVDSFSQMVREKGIDRDRLSSIVEDIFGMMVRKRYGADANFEIIANMEKGEIEIFLIRQIVETVENPAIEIDVATAREVSGEDLDVGEELVEVIPLDDFGRRLVSTAKQNLNQRIKEIEKDLIYDEYSEKVGDIVVGDVYQVRKNDVLINHNRTELLLPKSEQIGKERYRKGDVIRCVIKDVQRKGSGMPVVVVSRADKLFLQKLFEHEIPEVYDGIISIRKIAREPGERAKVAVQSHDDRIDAVGACVGMKGVRIHSIVRELNNENIDVINFTEDPQLFIQRALAPAKLLEVRLDKISRVAKVHVNPDQASLAIGRNGQNIRLASELTGFKIEIVKEGEEPATTALDEYEIELDEFVDDFGAELIERFKTAGYRTANDVIQAPVSELLSKIPGMTIEQLNDIVVEMKNAFNEEGSDDSE
ncbi:MAG: transcription termination/antitermination protein NusA [Ignavibacteriae bacterium]|nr:transcription termination/antitermination protein NusA [Ignavibacteriota bacterium]